MHNLMHESPIKRYELKYSYRLSNKLLSNKLLTLKVPASHYERAERDGFDL